MLGFSSGGDGVGGGDDNRWCWCEDDDGRWAGQTQAQSKVSGRTPGEKNLVPSSVENPVRAPWNFSSAPLEIFRPHPLEFFDRTP
ncbi:hypothetical protein Hanom_Chr11g01020151 [Helianthus anomalus]